MNSVHIDYDLHVLNVYFVQLIVWFIGYIILLYFPWFSSAFRAFWAAVIYSKSKTNVVAISWFPVLCYIALYSRPKTAADTFFLWVEY